MRLWLLGALLLAIAACGAYQFPGGSASPTSGTGTVTGRVLAFPCVPVEPAGSTCSGRPVPGLELDYVAGTAVLRKAITDSSGHYGVDLSPGSYTVRVKSYMRVLNGPLKLEITAGSTTVANYTLDSGIRAPVPQQ